MHWENGTCEQVVSHLDRELELNGLKAPDEQQINTVTQQATQKNSEKPKPTCHHCKSQVTIATSAVNSYETKTKPEITRIVLTITAILLVVQRTPTPIIKFLRIPTQTINRNQKDRRLRPVYQPCEICGKTNHSKEKCYFGANAANKLPPRKKTTGRTKSSPTENCPKQLRWECSSCSPNLKVETARLHLGTACDRPETTEKPKLLLIPEVVWRQPPETITKQCNSNNTKNGSTKQNTQQTSKTTEVSQTSPLREFKHRTT